MASKCLCSVVMLVSAVALLAVASAVADMAEGNGIATRPSRPRVFTSPEELRQYLAALSNYYAIEGRPRFGKRSGGEPLSAPPSFPESSSFSTSPYGGSQSFHSAAAARDLLDLLTDRN
ncbi:pro-neuropeptide Y-like [Ischnura elegans]|uniref:pro-neuropeptide Y-like n=1 Tax=Ischnura elegans TaxID=197161 RepID=UPI001ED866FD|nr:pro-neuropeptide Y-like [Ischnura elegans]